jgi:hypothetical protein
MAFNKVIPVRVRRNTSFTGTRMRKIPKSVRFEDEVATTYEVKKISQEEHDIVWYSSVELELLCRSEIRHNKAAEKKVEAGESIESNDLTWRGFEDLSEGYSKIEKSMAHTRAVLAVYDDQLDKEINDLEQLRNVSESLSKQDNERARAIGLRDADAVKAGKAKRTFKSWLRKSYSAVVPSHSFVSARS